MYHAFVHYYRISNKYKNQNNKISSRCEIFVTSLDIRHFFTHQIYQISSLIDQDQDPNKLIQARQTGGN